MLLLLSKINALASKTAPAWPCRSLEHQWLATRRHPSGFDYMRLLLALSVLLWHSYQVSYGTEAALAFWLKPPGLLLQLILPMFFSLSGFLVCASLLRLQSIPSFLALRVIRIFPALVVEVGLSALVLGPMLTTDGLSQYFTGREFVSYFANVFGWVHYLLPGVFRTNPVSAVNTSLWTIPFELECYIAIVIASLLGLYRNILGPIIALAISTVIVAFLVIHAGEHSAAVGGVHGRVLILCFPAGTVMYSFRKHLPHDPILAGACFAAAAFMFRYDATAYVAPILISYATVYAGLCDPPRTRIITSGDYSYGTYLYAGPWQQTAVLVLGSHNTWATNVLVALPLTMLTAVLSWHLVEKPFQAIKRLIKRQGNGKGLGLESRREFAAVEGATGQR